MITIENEDGEVVDVVSAADHAASIFEGRGSTSYLGASKVTSFRLPATLYAELQGLAHKGGKTKNATMTTLLEVGLEEVKARMSEESLEHLAEITSEYYEEMIQGSK